MVSRANLFRLVHVLLSMGSDWNHSMRDLVEKAKAGDLECFGILVDRYKDMAYGASYAILGNFHDAQDITQEAFVQAWQKLGTLKDCGGFPGWLYRITRNLSLDRVRRHRVATGSIDDVADTLPTPVDRNPRQCAEQNELHEAVLEAVRSLSEPNRLATSLFYINGYSVEEVADFLEVPAGTVKRRLHDSRSQLRERMVNMVEDTFKRNPLPKNFSRDALRRIGDFACLDILGFGGMGSVYLAEHPVLKHKVAINILAHKGPESLEFMRSGFAAVNRLNHPGFAKAFSTGEHQGYPFVVVEYLDGLPLHLWLKNGEARTLWDLLKIMVRLADAVSHAHERDVILGNIHPPNIIMLPNNAPVLVGVGAGKTIRKYAEAMRLAPSHRCAPECILGEPPDEKSDIWYLGIIMAELLMGKTLFDIEGDGLPPQANETAALSELSELKSRAPKDLIAILETCLRKDPQDRFWSAKELVRALEEAQFADLMRLAAYDIERLLREVEPQTLAVALGNASEEVAEHVCGNVNAKLADWIRHEIHDKPPTPDAAHAARCAVVTTASRLIDEHRISF